MLNNAVTLYRFVFLFVRRFEDSGEYDMARLLLGSFKDRLYGEQGRLRKDKVSDVSSIVDRISLLQQMQCFDSSQG